MNSELTSTESRVIVVSPKSKDVGVGAGIPRYLDVLFSFCGLLISAPLLLLVSAAVAISSRGSVIFRQTRMGFGGRTFTLYKFRTMHVINHGLPVTASDDSRITPVGRFLRKTKLDELPELWNVLTGDMSLVGPRPEVPRLVDIKNPLWQIVLRSKPGITDPVTLVLRNEETLLASVNGDREAFYLAALQPFKLQGYVSYLRQRSWRTDFRVLWNTCIAVFRPAKYPPPTLTEILSSAERVQ